MVTLNRVLFIWLITSLSACSIYDIKDEDSVYYAVPVGSLLVLNQDVTIAGDQVAVYVQNGELMLDVDVNKYNPNCKFEVYTISEQPRTVQTDTFEIIKVVDDIESSSVPKSIRLAVLDKALALGMLDRSYMFNYATLMYLNSTKQKDVYRLTCQHWEDMMDDRHLTIRQMRGAMGDVFTLKIQQ